MAAEYAAKKRESSQNKYPTFGEALESYIADREPVLSPATIREYRRNIKNYNDIKNIVLDQLSQEQIQTHINHFAANHSPKSVRDHHGIISAVMKVYRPEFALNTVLPQKKKPNLYIPSDKDIAAIVKTAAGTDMELPILLAAFGPMRRGEICALTSDNISGNRVHVCRNMVLNSNKEFIIKQPKSYAGDRYIDYPDFVAEKFHNIKGNITQLNPNMITSRFNHVLINSGVPHFRFHDLRHYCASIMHAIGVPDAYIMERGGWGNDSTLKEVYRHAMDEKSKEMSNKANSYFSAMQHEMQHEKEKA